MIGVLDNVEYQSGVVVHYLEYSDYHYMCSSDHRQSYRH